MLKIRLQRVGRKHEPTFRVVLTDSKNSTKSGRMLEVLGNHDPRHKEMTQLDADRIKHWISKGAQVTDTMHNMLISKKIIEGKKINVLPKKTVPQPSPEATAGEVKKEEAPVEPKAQPSSETTAGAAEETPTETPA
jgi:small subunit ribosomal protein S16